MLTRIAWRNIFRNKQRTVLTMGMMVFGYILFSFFLALAGGSYDRIIQQFIAARTGEIQVHQGDYLENPKLFKSITNYHQLMDDLEDNDFIKRTAPRIKGHALSFLNKKTMGASIIGIDLKREFQATSLKKRLTHGAFFEVDQREIVIGRKIARTLRATLGDDIVLISSGADGSIANDQYRVVGIIDNGENGMDDHIIYMSIQQAQEFFSLWGRVHEIVILTQHMPELYIKNKLVKKLSAGLTVSSWDEVEKDFYKAMQADRKGDSIIRFIIMFVVAIGVLNTVLMSILERTREFGVLKALGTTPKSIFLMITLETLILALLSISIGFVCAYLLNYYFSIHGIPFEAIEYGGFVFDEMRTNLNYSYFITPALVVMLVSIIVSVFPALKAAKTIPIEAMNS